MPDAQGRRSGKGKESQAETRRGKRKIKHVTIPRNYRQRVIVVVVVVVVVLRIKR